MLWPGPAALARYDSPDVAKARAAAIGFHIFWRRGHPGLFAWSVQQGRAGESLEGGTERITERVGWIGSRLPSLDESEDRTNQMETHMSEMGKRLIAAAKNARAIARGEADPATYRVYVPADVDVAGIRKKLGLSQAKFASRFGIAPGTLRDWEQRRKRPEGAARILLLVIDREPDAVRRALARPVERVALRSKRSKPVHSLRTISS